MEYLIRFVQTHETFRKPEVEALAELAGVRVEWLSYSEDSPFALVRLDDGSGTEGVANRLLSRSILANGIYTLWGAGDDYESLHRDVRERTGSLWGGCLHDSFRFELDSFHRSRSSSERREIYESFSYMGLEGPIVMTDPDHQFTVFEEYELDGTTPKRLFLGRLVAESGRKAINTYNLKKRRYIATTSMDAELSLVTANMALAGPGRLAYDPFMGTGSFPLACAHFGSAVFGSDMDGRSIRGRKDRNVRANFEQYHTSSRYLGGFIADLTNSPVRQQRMLDSIICDPPYGVREGLKVLGSTRAALQEVVLLHDGTPAHLQAGYVPPKKPYSFVRMLDDILQFGAQALVDKGRLCIWIPVAGPVESAEATPPSDGHAAAEYDVPTHPALELVSHCTQDFNKWSRRLLTYRRIADGKVDEVKLLAYNARRLALETDDRSVLKATADDLNDFRKQYFQGFKTPLRASFDPPPPLPKAEGDTS